MNLKTRLIKYCKDVINEKVIACLKYRQACKRLLSDFDREDKDDTFPYIFKPEMAERFLSFMVMFKHGKGALQGTPIIPTDYHVFVYGQLFGWINRNDGTLRFKKLYQQLGRKNGKSQLMGLIALYYACCMGEKSGEIYIAANVKAQTRHIYDCCVDFINNSPLKKAFTIKWDDSFGQKIIRHNKSSSVIVRLSRDEKSRDGQMASVGILDEYHESEDTNFRDMLAQSSKTRKSYLQTIITTAGMNLSSPCYVQEYSFITKLLDENNPIQDDTYLAIVAEVDINNSTEMITMENGRQIPTGEPIDVIGSKESILKANPVSGNSESFIKNILQETLDAKNIPDMYRTVMTKSYNVWMMNRPMGYMDMNRWKNCKVTTNQLTKIIKEHGDKCFIGFDLSAKLDLTSVSFIWPYLNNNTKKYAILSHSWIPHDKYIDNKDRVPYDKWKKDGYLSVTDGAVVDYTAVLSWIENFTNTNKINVAEYCLDPWGSAAVSTVLMNAGHTVVEVIQGLKTLAEPTKAFREAVYSQNVVHDNNPVLSWAVSNAVTRKDHNDNIMLDKSKATQRIDPIAATITAFTRALVVDLEPKGSFGVAFI